MKTDPTTKKDALLLFLLYIMLRPTKMINNWLLVNIY